MSIDKNDPASTASDQTDAQIESLEPAEIEDPDLETVSGGGVHPLLPISSFNE